MSSRRDYVAVSTFEVRNELDDAVDAAFLQRPHLVDDAPGFVSMEVLRGTDNPKLFWLITRWTDEDSYRAWHRGHTYKESHVGIPKGLKLVPKSAVVHTFHKVCE
jgi:heme-degrading monooxygenase HmoA